MARIELSVAAISCIDSRRMEIETTSSNDKNQSDVAKDDVECKSGFGGDERNCKSARYNEGATSRMSIGVM